MDRLFTGPFLIPDRSARLSFRLLSDPFRQKSARNNVFRQPSAYPAQNKTHLANYQFLDVSVPDIF